MKRNVLITLAFCLASCTNPTREKETAQAVLSTNPNACITEASGLGSLNCTANDVAVSQAVAIRIEGTSSATSCIQGELIPTLIGTFRVVLNSTSRLDPRFFFATGGQGTALTGVCDSAVITPDNAVFTNLDSDTCGDLSGTQLVDITLHDVLCTAGANGELALPVATSWRQPGSDTVCNSFLGTGAGTKAKCNSNAGFTVPIKVEHGALSVTKAATPLSLPEPGGEFTFPVSATNTATFTTLTIDRICDDRYGTVAGTGCPAGTLGAVNSTDCTVPQTLAPGASYACSFKGSFTAQDPATDTDTVTFSGTDANGGPVSASASATVTITDVPPTATATKGFVADLCSTVRIGATVANPNPTDTLTLLALSDSHFGDLFTVHGDVLATTCATTTIPVGGSTTCTFDARFCALTETDSFIATFSDGEGNVFTVQSNTLAISVGITVGP